jgi:phospholipase C
MAAYRSSDRRDEELVQRVLSRRHLLELALAGTAGVALAGRLGHAANVHRAAATPPAGSDLGAVEHVVFLMQENRSFDHYFGTYPGVRGFDDHPAKSNGVFAQRASTVPGGVLLPFHLDISSGMASCTHDLTHSWTPQHLCWDQGRMSDFVKVHTMDEYEGPGDGVLTMGYYGRKDVPYHYALADNFTLCDNYHCSVMAPTHPNRLMAVSGTLDPAGLHGGPVLITNPSPAAKYSVDWPTMPEVLEDAGVSWKVYNPPGPLYDVSLPSALAITDSVMAYFKQYSNPGSTLYDKAFNYTFPGDFTADVRNGTLPKVSWLIPMVGHDEHPPAPSSLGAATIDSVLQALLDNPKVWSKTVLFVMYDENDGFFDHVAPPVAPPGTPGEYVTVRPLPSAAGGIAGPIGLGFRVPMFVVSPFSRGGRVFSQVSDHTSQLRFLEERFGVRAPNLSRWRRKTVSDLTGALRLGSADTSRPRLPSTDGDTEQSAEGEGCSSANFYEVGTDQPQYPITRPQVMPRQV